MILSRPITKNFMKMDLVICLSRYVIIIEKSTCLKPLKISKKDNTLTGLGVIAGIQIPIMMVKMPNNDLEMDLVTKESQ